MTATELWRRYVGWLGKNAPLAHANLAGPASGAQIAEVERVTGQALPEGVKDVWRLNNGQKETMIASTVNDAIVCIPTLSLLSTELAISIWRDWDKLRRTDVGIDELQSCGRSPEEGVVQPLYTHPGWIPLWSDPTGADFIGVDLAPGPKGQRGQIINFGRDEEEHRCYAPRFEDLLQILLEEVEGGAWPASERTGSKGDKQPWLGDPEEHFFNALYARWKRRMPPNPRELVQEAQAALKAGEAARAGELLAQARGLGMKEGSISWSLTAQVCEAQERWRDAEAAWARTTEVAPKLAKHWEARLANLIFNLHAYDEAEAVATAALAAHPDSDDFVYERARIAYFRDDYATASTFYGRYAALNPDDASARSNHAWALGATGNADEAVAEARAAFDAADEDEGAVAIEAGFYLYALVKSAEQPERLARLRALLDAGTRTEDWNFAPIIATAAARKHPEAAWLAKLAAVANGAAGADQLASWPAWSAAATPPPAINR
ncbi:MAG TPA: SMI1/KNR4 family protein [Polyangia bacterium]|jgi:cell wall assembly regulator SMI1